MLQDENLFKRCLGTIVKLSGLLQPGAARLICYVCSDGFSSANHVVNGFDTRRIKKCKYKKETEKERKQIHLPRVPEVHAIFWPKIPTSGHFFWCSWPETWKFPVQWQLETICREKTQTGGEKNIQTNENKDYGRLLLLSIEETCSKRNLTQTSNLWLSFLWLWIPR